MNDSIPKFQEFFPHVLACFAASEPPLTRTDVQARLAETMPLSASQLEIKNPKTNITVVRHRINWTTVYLTKAGLLQTAGSTDRGQRLLAITDEGRQLHAKLRSGEVPALTHKYLKENYQDFRLYHDGNQAATGAVADDGKEEVDAVDARLEELIQESNDGVYKELLHWMGELGQRGMESLAGRLFTRMGYETLLGTGQSGGAGLQGLTCYESPSFDQVHALVRHVRRDGDLGVDLVQQFHGYVAGQSGRGLLLTNQVATEVTNATVRASDGLVRMLDGPRLSELLVRHRVGVVEDKGMVLYRVDSDVFRQL